MAGVLLIRADDHLILGVRWSGFTASQSGAFTRLVAGAQARLVLVLPPQHIGEESSPPGSAAPAQPTGSGGETVSVWSGVLSAPTRLAFTVDPGVQIPLTVEGVLDAVLNNSLLVPAGAPGPDDTAIELPWGLVVAPHGPSGTVCRHLTRPVSTGSSGLWRTRIADPHGAGLTLRVADPGIAGRLDPAFQPGNTLPLPRSHRLRLASKTTRQPADLTRLELSSLGGTVSATGLFPNFEWEHRAHLGRDMHVRTRASGVLYPLGHRAEFVEATERIYDQTKGGAAVLRTVRVLTIVEPVRRVPADGPIRRAFPFGDVEITRTVFRDLADADATSQSTVLPGVGAINTHFWPTTLSGRKKVPFPVACATSGGVVRMDLPLLFVYDLRPVTDSLASPVLAQRLAGDYSEVEVAIAPTILDLAGVSVGPLTAAVGDPVAAADHEVRKLKIGGSKIDDGLDLATGYRPKLTELKIGFPALRALHGEDPQVRVAFARKYLQSRAEDVILEMVPPDVVPIDFSKAADRSGGLLALKYGTNAISRSWGPVDRSSLPNPSTGFIDPARLFPDESATLLGFPLKSLLAAQLKLPPEITTIPRAGQAPEVRMQWKGIDLTSAGSFRAKPNVTKLDLTVATGPGGEETTCVVNDFTLELPPAPKAAIRLSFGSLRFSQSSGKSPRLEVLGNVKVEVAGDLTLLRDLASACDLGAAGELIDVRPTGLTAHYSLAFPSLPATGAFTFRNLAITAGIEIPFDGRPLSVLFGFSSRTSPFQISIMMFGGGGYLEIWLDQHGVRRIEASLEFGAFLAVDFVVARGEVHALGGVRFVLEEDGSVTISGSLRIGGCLKVLGLISVSVELCLAMTYQSQRNALVGRATLVLEIDLTLWSDRVELDSGEWVLPAGTDHLPLHQEINEFDGPAEWRAYRAAFAREV